MIRTLDPQHPMLVRYQTALRPVSTTEPDYASALPACQGISLAFAPVDGPLRLLERGDLLLEGGLLLQHALRLDVVVPEVRQGAVALDQRDAALLAVDVKETPGGSRASPGARSSSRW